MNNYIPTFLQFPPGKLSADWITQFEENYTIPVSSTVAINGVTLELSPRDPAQTVCVIYADNGAGTMYRSASFRNGSIVPVPVYNPPLEAGEIPGEAHTLIGERVYACFSETFLSDLQRDPQPEPELFDGVQIVEHSDS